VGNLRGRIIAPMADFGNPINRKAGTGMELESWTLINAEGR